MKPDPLRTVLVAWLAVASLPTAGPAEAQQGAVAEYPIRHAAHDRAPASARLRDNDLVLGVAEGGEARAYPLALLWGEPAHTVNDELGKAPIAVAFCPLAGVGAAFSRRSAGETLELGHVSEVERDTLVMYDRATRSRWGLLTAEAFRGPLAGRRLDRISVLQTTWGRWRALHPGTTVYVAPDQAEAGFQLDDQTIRRIVLAGSGEPRRSDWVLGLQAGERSAAIVLRGLAKRRVLNTALAERPLVVFLSEDLTTAVAWRREADGRVLTFSVDGELLVDAETGSSWDPLTGKARSGPLAGRSLEPMAATTGFWHAWQSHHPETLVLGLADD